MKETTYQQKIPLVAPWLEEIIDTVKRDLKTEHLKKDRTFCNRYFMGQPLNRIPTRELAKAYAQEIEEGNIGLAEFIATRWLLKNTDIYGFFEEQFAKITSDFEELQELEGSFAHSLQEESIKRFGAKRTFLFSLFNSVVFSDAIYQELQSAALEEKEESEEIEQEKELAKVKERYERKIAALVDKYEKKLAGFQKKYIHDTEALKKKLADGR